MLPSLQKKHIYCFQLVLKFSLLAEILMDVEVIFSRIANVTMARSIAFLNVYFSLGKNVQRTLQEKSYEIEHDKLQ